ncbi:hypothetical protein PV396_20165 [Streptomyces sp. ME02-8801-2C]|uniref:hypothetical protein n=1 Tax=Streptomyces sp. ME02-8801-2C TaxID=3028680 RepID=UPI0029B94164|nr:hypothetical protein [Streptomyces sp. ME02-8801-2C]MDX3454232.1 hypothetical protein [Streptomyces sp. ME02-8801-2C]
MRNAEFLVELDEGMLDYFRQIAEEMVSRFGISRAEAVARINSKYKGARIDPYPDLMCHETPEYWAYGLYFQPVGGQLPYGAPDENLSAWEVRPAPSRNSHVWTIREWLASPASSTSRTTQDRVRMSRTFNYRFQSPMGGLAADLTAECVPPGTGEEFFLQVARYVRLSLPQGVYWRDASWLAFGLTVHAPDLISRNPQGMLVRVTSVDFPLAHFRSEVAALAMDGWIRQEFDLPDRGLRAFFDSERGSYGFQWGEHAEPFPDDLPK